MYSRNSGAFTVLDDLVIAYRLIHVFLELCVKTLHMNMTSTARAEMDSMGDSEDGDRSFDDQQAHLDQAPQFDVLVSPGVRTSLSHKTCEELLGVSGDLMRLAPGDGEGA
jgi:hypothetical protein